MPCKVEVNEADEPADDSHWSFPGGLILEALLGKA